MNKNIFVPSFKFERKTGALNKSSWGFVGVISMFTIEMFVIVFHLILCYLFDVKSTFILDNLISVSIITVMIFALIFGIGLYKFFILLLHSYKFENNKIIKGKITKSGAINNKDLIIDAVMVEYMAENIKDSNKVLTGNTAININRILSLIKLNMNQNFANQFFDSDVYKKKVFNNPKLLKETKYNLIYICDNNKKVVIPKLYEGMNVKLFSSKEKSILSRVILRSLIIFIICLILSLFDFFIGINNNPKYIYNMNNTCTNIKENLNSYGYDFINECQFKKVASSNRTSTINYKIDKNGNVIKVDFDLYYNNENYNDEELKYIINSMNANFKDADIDSFIDQVNSCVNGNCSYNKITTEKYTLRIGTSNGFINIHNW